MQYMRSLLEVHNDQTNEKINQSIIGIFDAYIKPIESHDYPGSLDSVVRGTHLSQPLSFSEAYVLRQRALIFKKLVNPRLHSAKDRINSAYEKFLQAEVNCKNWNTKLKTDGFDPAATEFLCSVAKRISRMLGPVPSLPELGFSFGPGSSSNCKQTSLRYKLTSVPAISNVRSIDAARSFLETCPTWSYFHKGKLDVVPAKLTFVPKNSEIDRPIIIEPSLNTVVQKGIGNHIREVLLRHNVDLRKGQKHNRDLAQVGSFTGTLSTLDLSSASDSIPFGLVRELLPPDWFQLLCSWRSDYVTIPKSLQGRYIGDHTLKLNKFSSMGNGFTFELESLLFYAICLEASDRERRRHILVYGDDIICHTDDYINIVDKLSLCNFTVNNKKSFTGDNPFRESCGGDFYYGHDITPFYIKEKWNAIKVVEFLNHVNSKLSCQGLHYALFSLFSSYFKLQFDSGPAGYGLGYYHVRNFRKPSISHDLSGYFIQVYRFKPKLLPKQLKLKADGLIVASYRSMVTPENVFDERQTRGHEGKVYRARTYVL